MKDILSIRRVIKVLLIVIMAVLLYSCGGGGNGDDPVPSSGGDVLTLGSWSGNGVSFTLSEGSYWINDLSVTYSGSATGTICRFDYNITETIGADIPAELDAVTDDWIFSYDSPELTIEGVFTSGTSAELELTWSFYNDVCDVTVTGNDVLYADQTSAFPVAGNWRGPSGFGEIELVVASDSTEIESIAITLNDFSCGGVISNGTITQTGSTAISNNQFTANIDWTNNAGDGRSMEIIGTFDDSGTSASGTYEADYDGTLSNGIWDAEPE